MGDCNDIRWKLDDIKLCIARMEQRQLSMRERTMISLLKTALSNKVVQVALGDSWVALAAEMVNVD